MLTDLCILLIRTGQSHASQEGGCWVTRTYKIYRKCHIILKDGFKLYAYWALSLFRNRQIIRSRLSIYQCLPFNHLRLGVQGAMSSQLLQTMRGMVYFHPSEKSFSKLKQRNPEKGSKTLSKYCRIPVSSEARRLCSCPSIICRERLRYAREERGSFAIAPEPWFYIF